MPMNESSAWRGGQDKISLDLMDVFQGHAKSLRQAIDDLRGKLVPVLRPESYGGDKVNQVGIARSVSPLRDLSDEMGSIIGNLHETIRQIDL